jgi:hypothetical protein
VIEDTGVAGKRRCGISGNVEILEFSLAVFVRM